MARDEAEEERAFLAELEARTGRTLEAWMKAIAAQGFADKNETIDWLRAQGFPFARASWLERIHSNGGRPIYGGGAHRPHDEERPRPAAKRPAASVPPPGSRAAAELERLLAAAKGYRPLYLLLEEEVRRAIPDVIVLPKSTHVALAAPAEFAAVGLHPTELRLGLALGDLPFDDLLQRPKLRGAGPAVTHMLVLTDARQVNADLIRLIKTANTRVNG